MATISVFVVLNWFYQESRLNISRSNDTPVVNFLINIILADPYSFVHAADKAYCTVPPSIALHHEAVLLETRNALMDRDPSTCIQLFADGRNLFQFSIEYLWKIVASLDIWVSGTGFNCEQFMTIYVANNTENEFLSQKKECVFVENTIGNTGTTDCQFRCRPLISQDDEVLLTLTTQSPMWATDFHKDSHLCDLKIIGK